MASEVDIANLALGHLGDDAGVTSISPSDGSVQAAHCARFYPIARDTLLEEHAWTFATTRTPLSVLDMTVDGWDYVYAVPTLLIRGIEVYTSGVEPTPNNPIAFEIETLEDGTQILLTDAEDAILRYVVKVTDPTKFTPLFTEALSWLLASMLAGPILKGEIGNSAAKECYKVYLDVKARATGSNANSGRVIPPAKTTSWIANR